MRLLGVDVGARRIGLAISDASATLARPLRTLELSHAVDQGVEAVAQEIASLQGDDDGLAGVVVGFPRALGGESNAQTRYVVAFVERLRGRTSLPLFLQDERLTSHEAESRLAVREKNWRKRKHRLDAAAAAVILQDHLDERRRPGSDVGEQETT